MVQEAPTLYPEVRDAAVPKNRGYHGYYKRGDNDWVVVASVTPANRGHYEEKGFTYLPKYGQFINGQMGGRPTERDKNGVPWNPAEEPWRQIFQMNGVAEFPVEQVIAYRWHIRPPYREVVFPQLEGLDITTYFCPECDKGVFSSPNPLEAAAQLRTHLTSGINRQHEYRPADLKGLAEEFGIDFESRRISRRQVTESPALHDVVELNTGAPEPGEANFDCDQCDWKPKKNAKSPGFALMAHKRSHV